MRRFRRVRPVARRAAATLAHTALRPDVIWDRAERLVRPGDADGTRNYRRMVVLTNPRSGSNLLLSTIDQHPAVDAASEPFNPRQTYLPGASEHPRLAGLLRFADPSRFIESVVLRPLPSSVLVSGFKVMNSQARHPAWRTALGDFITNPDVLIISLRRENRLAMHLSYERALRSDEWTRSQERSSQSPIVLDPLKCESFFRSSAQLDREHASLLRDRQPDSVLRITYETMLDRFDETMHAVQAFLDVEPQTLAPSHQKQRTKPLPESIANYTELERHFAGSEWEDFFGHDDFDQAVT